MDTNGDRRDAALRYALEVDRLIAVAPAAAFDGFLDIYETDSPDWIVESHLDLRVGGSWVVVFQPPGRERFAETRVITALDRPRLLAYETAVLTAGGRRRFAAAVRLACAPEVDGTRVRLRQRGLPTAALRDEFARAWADVLWLLEERVRRT